jgi:hypothetical protein
MRLGQNTYQIFYAPDGGGGSSGGGAAATGGQATPPAGDGGTQNAGRAGAGSDEPAWLGPRLERAARKAREDAFAEIGIAPDEIGAFKDTIAKHRETESEVVKTKRQAEQLAKDLAKAQGVIAGYEQEKRHRTVRDSLLGAISAEGLAGRHVNDAEDLIYTLSDPRKPNRVGITDDGELSVFENGNPARGKDVSSFLKGYLDSRPFLLKPVMGEGGAGSRTGGSDGAKPKELDLSKASHAEKAAAAKAAYRERMKQG